MIFDDRIGVRDYPIDPDQAVQLLELSRRVISLAGFKVNSTSKTNHTRRFAVCGAISMIIHHLFRQGRVRLRQTASIDAVDISDKACLGSNPS
jgi:hypothetical protein